MVVLKKLGRLFSKSLEFSHLSYSQEGEDIVLGNFLGDIKNGFYVDVGAHHPFRFSNTYNFYKKGWKGINIDATPGSMRLFDKHRSRDTNIETVISNFDTIHKFYIFEESALNSCSTKLSNDRSINTPHKIEKTIKLRSKKLSQILDKYLPVNTAIDFLSIDVEGHEHEVVLSNDWTKYKPTYILIEILQTQLTDLQKNRTYKFLMQNGYTIVACTGRTVIFKKL
jgi:FkbM family methyltransferase